MAIAVRTATGSLRERWRRQPPRVRRNAKLALQALVVLVLLPGYTALALLFAMIFAFAHVPERANLPWILSKPRAVFLPLVVLLLVVLYPQFRDRTGNLGNLGSLGHVGTMPLFGDLPSVDTGVVMLVYVMMAIGLNIVVGYAGLLDLGYVAFYAIGAYTAGWFASPQFAHSHFHLGPVGLTPGIPGFHINMWLVLVMAGVITALAGVIIGLPTLRLRGDYLAIVTLGFGEIMPQIARNGDNLFGTGFNLTNGAQGINPIDSLGFGNSVHNAVGLPSSFIADVNSIKYYYWTGVALVLFTVFCSWRLRDSRLGRAWIAIREDETAAAAMGIPLMRTKTWAYAAGAFFGGIAGAFFASYKTATFPDDFQFNISVFILCMVILGGMGSIWGVIAGGAFLAYLNQDGLGSIGGWLNQNLGVQIDVAKYSFLIYGIIILVVMLFRPEGLIPSGRRKAELEEGVSDQPLYDATST